MAILIKMVSTWARGALMAFVGLYSLFRRLDQFRSLIHHPDQVAQSTALGNWVWPGVSLDLLVVLVTIKGQGKGRGESDGEVVFMMISLLVFVELIFVARCATVDATIIHNFCFGWVAIATSRADMSAQIWLIHVKYCLWTVIIDDLCDLLFHLGRIYDK